MGTVTVGSKMDSAFRRVLIYDPSLIHRFGHFYVQTKALCDALNRRGFEHECLVSDKAGDIVDELNAKALLNYPAWNVKYLEAYTYAANWTNANLCAEQGLRRSEKIGFRSDDLLLMHSVSPNEIMAIRNWYAGLGSDRPYLLACLHAPAKFYATDADKELATTLFARGLSDWMPLIDTGRVRIGATTPELGAYVSQLGRMTVTVVPLIVPISGIRHHAFGPPRERLTFSFTGFTPEKGLAPLVSVLGRHEFEGVNFRLQIGMSQTRDNVRNTLRHRSNVEVVAGFSDSDAYDRFIGTSDGILLPYDPSAYHLRHSSIFMEAIGAGKPILVTADTCMAREAIELGLPGVLMQGFNEEALANAIRRLRDDFRVRKSIAERVSSAYAGRLTVDAYIDRLVRWFPRGRPNSNARA